MSNGPLSINLSTSTAKTSVPTIPENVKVPFRLIGITSNTPEGKSGPVLTFEFELVQPTVDKSGKTLNPGDFGSKQFHKVYCYAKEGSKDPTYYLGKIAQIQDALLGTGDPGNDKGKPERPDFNDETAAQLYGKVLIATMKVKSDEFGGGNEFGKLQFPADAPQ